MSIATELQRIQGAKADIKSAIEAKGVTVPSNALIDDYDTYIGQISGGGGGGQAEQDLKSLIQRSLTNMTIPSGMLGIGNYAFADCISLSSVTIPNSVTTIGSNAFYQCNSLTSITLPSGVTSIGTGAFNYCTGLTSIGGVGSGASIEIPSGVTQIGDNTFSGCTGLTSVNLPNSVTSIGTNAFNQCSGLTSVTIPDSVTTIGQYAFRSTSSLTSITCMATTAPTIFNNTFRDVSTGGTLYVPTGSTGYDVWMGTGNYYLGKYGWTIEYI